MPDREALAVCEVLASRIREARLPVTGLVLYGSMARGEAHEWSDIDVMVLVQDEVPRDKLRDVRRAVYRIAARLDSRIELIAVYAGAFESDGGTPIIEIARTEGIRIAA